MEINESTIAYFRQKAAKDARDYFGMDAEAQAEFINWFDKKIDRDFAYAERTRESLAEAEENLEKAEKYRRDELDGARGCLIAAAAMGAGMFAGEAIGNLLGDGIIGMGLGMAAGGLLGS